MSKVRKIPMRKCLGCGENKAKKDLIRIVKNKENEIFFDETGKQNGRGAYICFNEKCLEKAFKTKALNRTFKMEISDEIYAQLKESINKQ
ncbi:RNase P modulator RnpM [Peptoniphilus obesi]|uniref:RNase P modulator RnpM n=1 Tax=Peptoniphilus obesi TaxID=1472765 RepID=UPI0004B1A8A7|nr:YlxR family protein [Peptoniphilus obesi]